jgi:PIN domain nuclease of toxin-antitoxin system
VIHLDTHVVVWLYAGNVKALSRLVAERITNDDDLVISPVVALEIDFLHEIGKVTEAGETMIADLGRRLALRLARSPFADVVAAAKSLVWTRDPFDRLIVAHAVAENANLATRDRVIRRHFKRAIWD